MTKCYHASDAEFDSFDYDLLGQSTERNSAPEEAVRMAKLGVWLSDRPLDGDMCTAHLYEVELDMDGYDVKHVTYDELWYGQADEADIYVVDDDEFGCVSYVVTEAAKDAMTILSKH